MKENKEKPLTPNEIIENCFSVRTISIINDFLSERYKPGSSVIIKFKEFKEAWQDYTDSYKTLIKNEFERIDELYELYGWVVVDVDKGKRFFKS